MWIEKIILTDVRSFSGINTIELSRRITLLVGPNNSGKSTVVHAILPIQGGYLLGQQDIRVGKSSGNVEIYFKDAELSNIFPKNLSKFGLSLRPDGTTSSAWIDKKSVDIHMSQFLSVEPNNFLYPYLSKRKVGGYSETINEAVTKRVTGTLQDLYAKVDKLSNSQLPGYQSYMDACQNILGFMVTCISSPNGKKACYVIDNFKSVTIDKMGEGVASILGLLVDLCMADSKLFIIEEPENDIHPKALKGLVELIIDKSKTNQFIITTHSNIITKYLGAEDETKIYRVNIEFDNERIPTSRVEKIINTPEARRELLETLGYELNDIDLCEGWLFLEEASAEKIVRQYLIPWFATKLQGRLRTFSARTINEVEMKFNDFNRLFSFLNLQPVYKNKAWIIVDKGDREKETIEKLKQVYTKHGWRECQFLQFDKHDFERYYPEEFKERVEGVLKISNTDERRKQKKALLEEVESWINCNEDNAKASFEKSAREVISKLKKIEEMMTVKN